MPGRPILDTRVLEQLLATRSADVAARVRETVVNLKPCVEATSIRASEHPLRAGTLAKLLGRKTSPARLLPTASKFGGVPYSERRDHADGTAFLGQINFAETASELSVQGNALPLHMPDRGILALHTSRHMADASVRWYPAPDAASHVDPGPMPSTGACECAMVFSGGWSLKGLDWYSAVPGDDGELLEYLIEFESDDVDGHHHERYHKLFGHTDEILNEFFGVERARRGSRPEDYIQVCRITFDNQAGFSWGTNWLYVLLHHEDLAVGDFGKSVVMVANA